MQSTEKPRTGDHRTSGSAETNGKPQGEDRHWDSLWSEMLDRPWNVARAEKYASFSTIESMIEEAGPASVIEVGGGSGLSTILLAAKYGFDPTFLDLSRNALEILRRNVTQADIQRPRLVQGDALRLPFGSGSFDLVWSGGLNEHFEGTDRQQIFDEMARITRPGGLTLVTVPNRAYWPLNLHRWLGQKRGTWAFGYEDPFSVRELEDRMEKAGLRMRSLHQTNFFIGLHFLLSSIPLVARMCDHRRPAYAGLWSLLQRLDRKWAVKPGLELLALGFKPE